MDEIAELTKTVLNVVGTALTDVPALDSSLLLVIFAVDTAVWVWADAADELTATVVL